MDISNTKAVVALGLAALTFGCRGYTKDVEVHDIESLNNIRDTFAANNANFTGPLYKDEQYVGPSESIKLSLPLSALHTSDNGGYHGSQSYSFVDKDSYAAHPGAIFAVVNSLNNPSARGVRMVDLLDKVARLEPKASTNSPFWDRTTDSTVPDSTVIVIECELRLITPAQIQNLSLCEANTMLDGSHESDPVSSVVRIKSVSLQSDNQL